LPSWPLALAVAVLAAAPAGSVTRRVGTSGKIRFRLPDGLPASSLLLLRSGDDWLDYRNFHSPVFSGRDQDSSVRWDQPGAELAALIAAGEGPRAEFKQEIPCTKESQRNVLKTIAAFASGDGGIAVFGVTDELQPVGLAPGDMDRHIRTITSLIRDSITPEPSYKLRTDELDGHALLLVDVSPGRGWHALGPAAPSFYVRRGSSTGHARMDEIERGFAPPPRRGL
jgi:hypothetical protein